MGMSSEYRVGSIPDTIKGSPMVEEAEEQYKVGYGMGVCLYLKQAFPEDFQRLFPGGEAECVQRLGTAADAYFDAWKIKYPRGVVQRALATLAAAGQ